MKLVLAGVGALALLCAAALGWSLRGIDVAADPDGMPSVFTVEPGETLTSVARRLDAQGLLPRHAFFGPRTLLLYARYAGVERSAKAGEYELAASMTPREILDKIVAGVVKMYPVTLPEGLRLDEIAVRLEQAGIVSAEGFLARARDAALASQLGVGGDGFEGYLYPETYLFRADSSPEEIVTRMYEELRSRLRVEDEAAMARIGMSLHQVVTLASIVEKETAVGEERPLISAVFHNRLRKKMRLQSDPTVIYGIVRTRGRFDGNIRGRDLRDDNPYNTYTRAGLPPGPIASTTIESIRAALAPADVPYLFFVSRNDGTHVFSRTLSEHVSAVDRFQRPRPRSGS